MRKIKPIPFDFEEASLEKSIQENYDNLILLYFLTYLYLIENSPILQDFLCLADPGSRLEACFDTQLGNDTPHSRGGLLVHLQAR